MQNVYLVKDNSYNGRPFIAFDTYNAAYEVAKQLTESDILKVVDERIIKIPLFVENPFTPPIACFEPKQADDSRLEEMAECEE